MAKTKTTFCAKTLRRSAAALVGALSCSDGASFDDVHQSVVAFHGKPIVLHPTSPEGLQNHTGLWFDFPASSIIFYRDTDSYVYQRHSILHEFGHIIANHSDCIGITHAAREAYALKSQQVGAKTDDIFLHDDAEIFAEAIAYALIEVMLRDPVNDLAAVFG